MERLSPSARALLDAAQRSEGPSAEFRARFDRNWQRRASQVGIGVAGALATSSLVAKSASGSSAASGAAAVVGGSALSKGVASVALAGVVGKIAATVGVAAIAGSVSYALWVPPEVEVSAPVPTPVVRRVESPGPNPPVEPVVVPGAATATWVATEPSGDVAHTASPPSSVSPERRAGSEASSRPEIPPKAAVPSPSAESAEPVTPTSIPRSSLTDRVRELQRAHELLRDGAPESALELLEPDTPSDADALSVEREALRIAALCRVADPEQRDRGRALASAFERAHPSSPMLGRLRRECAR